MNSLGFIGGPTNLETQLAGTPSEATNDNAQIDPEYEATLSTLDKYDRNFSEFQAGLNDKYAAIDMERKRGYATLMANDYWKFLESKGMNPAVIAAQGGIQPINVPNVATASAGSGLGGASMFQIDTAKRINGSIQTMRAISDVLGTIGRLAIGVGLLTGRPGVAAAGAGVSAMSKAFDASGAGAFNPAKRITRR